MGGRDGGEFDQGIWYACVEVSQWTPFIHLMYANKKETEKNRDKCINL
jgi:hypothetical protein